MLQTLATSSGGLRTRDTVLFRCRFVAAWLCEEPRAILKARRPDASTDSATARYAEAEEETPEERSVAPARLGVCRRRGGLCRGIGRRRLSPVVCLARSAELRKPRPVRAAGDDAHSRARRTADCRVCPSAADLRPDQHHPEARHPRFPLG